MKPESIQRNQITEADFDYIQRLIFESSAIVIKENKEYYVETRLRPIATDNGFPSISELIAELRCSNCEILRRQIVEALTNNETSFFRDYKPFESLRRIVIPEILKKNREQKTLRIWSAACSTGQETYSLAMLLDEHFPQLAHWDITILGTDINTQVLEKAQAGSYVQQEISRGLPTHLLVKYFDKCNNEWTIKERIRKKVKFLTMNLAGEWPMMPVFDLILLRNVLIYFDSTTKNRIFEKLRTVCNPDGYLLLGAADSALNTTLPTKRIEYGNTIFIRFI